MDHCLAPATSPAGVGCDNMTVVIVAFKHKGSLDTLYENCLIPKQHPPPFACQPASYPEELISEVQTLL